MVRTITRHRLVAQPVSCEFSRWRAVSSEPPKRPAEALLRPLRCGSTFGERVDGISFPHGERSMMHEEPTPASRWPARRKREHSVRGLPLVYDLNDADPADPAVLDWPIPGAVPLSRPPLADPRALSPCARRPPSDHTRRRPAVRDRGTSRRGKRIAARPGTRPKLAHAAMPLCDERSTPIGRPFPGTVDGVGQMQLRSPPSTPRGRLTMSQKTEDATGESTRDGTFS